MDFSASMTGTRRTSRPTRRSLIGSRRGGMRLAWTSGCSWGGDHRASLRNRLVPAHSWTEGHLLPAGGVDGLLRRRESAVQRRPRDPRRSSRASTDCRSRGAARSSRPGRSRRRLASLSRRRLRRCSAKPRSTARLIGGASAGDLGGGPSLRRRRVSRPRRRRLRAGARKPPTPPGR